MRGDGPLGCHSQGLVGNYQLSDHQVFPTLILSCALPHPLFLDRCSKWGIKRMGLTYCQWLRQIFSGDPPAPLPQQDSLCDGPVLQGCCMLIWPIVSGWLLSQCLRTKALCVDLCFALFNIYIWILARLQRQDIKAAMKKGILLSAFDGRILRRDLCQCFAVCDAARILDSTNS